jgi:hypothetical protein
VSVCLSLSVEIGEREVFMLPAGTFLRSNLCTALFVESRGFAIWHPTIKFLDEKTVWETI